MDLNTVTDMVTVRDRGDLAKWSDGAAWLAGGTWLFSEPQPTVHKLLDLAGLGWAPIAGDEAGLHVAATCTFAQLAAFSYAPDLVALDLIQPCCQALLGSFKVWNVATVGGNICLALPAAPMIAFTVALDGSALIWTAEGGERRIPVLDFVLGPTQTALRPGEVLRQIDLPASALRRRTVHRRASLTDGGRSAALLIGTREGAAFSLTITAAIPRPVRLDFPELPSPEQLRAELDRSIAPVGYYDDVHGRPDWRRHLTHLLAEEIRADMLER